MTSHSVNFRMFALIEILVGIPEAFYSFLDHPFYLFLLANSVSNHGPKLYFTGTPSLTPVHIPEVVGFIIRGNRSAGRRGAQGRHN